MTNRRSFIGGAAAGIGALGTSRSVAALPSASATGSSGVLRKLTAATIRIEDQLGLGLRVANGVLDVRAAEKRAKTGAPLTLEAALQGEGNLAALPRLVEWASRDLAAFVHHEADISFGLVVSNAPKILCIGLNYHAHVAEANQPVPTTPIFFNKYDTSLNAHRGTIRVSAENAKAFDYEAELVAILGKGGRNIDESSALDYVAGYCVGQDFSARDLQMATSQWMIGKAGDGWGPLGPWLVGAELLDPQRLNIECKVNGEIRQSSNTSRMIFSVAQQISYLSKHLTLEAGDVIFTGTPDGVIIGYPKEKQVWLKAGDRVETIIDGIGSQEVLLI